jgi:hypothetical protein
MIRIPTRQDWQKPEKIIEHNVDLWFTDGSGIQDCFGAGIYGPPYNRESIPMGSLSTVFSAEVMAILRCTELLLTKNLWPHESIKEKTLVCATEHKTLTMLSFRAGNIPSPLSTTILGTLVA